MRKDSKKLDKEDAHKVLRLLRDGFVAITQTHPVVLCLLGMGSVVGAKFVMGKERPENAHLHRHLNNWYDTCSNIAFASVSIPVVTGGLNLVGQYLAMKKPA